MTHPWSMHEATTFRCMVWIMIPVHRAFVPCLTMGAFYKMADFTINVNQSGIYHGMSSTLPKGAIPTKSLIYRMLLYRRSKKYLLKIIKGPHWWMLIKRNFFLTNITNQSRSRKYWKYFATSKKNLLACSLCRSPTFSICIVLSPFSHIRTNWRHVLSQYDIDEKIVNIMTSE